MWPEGEIMGNESDELILKQLPLLCVPHTECTTKDVELKVPTGLKFGISTGRYWLYQDVNNNENPLQC